MTAAQQAIHEDAEGTASRLLAIVRKRPLTPVEEQRLMRASQRKLPVSGYTDAAGTTRRAFPSDGARKRSLAVRTSGMWPRSGSA